MAERLSFGNLEFSFGKPGGPRPDPDVPLKIGVIGDFSGRSTRAPSQTGESLAARATPAVDVDELDEVIARTAVEIVVPVDSGSATISVSELDDFHPDRLYERLPAFTQLRTLRQATKDPATFAAAAARAAPPETGPSPAPSAGDGAGDFAALLGRKSPAAGPATAAGGKVDISALIKQIVGDTDKAPAHDPRQGQLIAGVDGAISQLMRTILHHPAVQRVEGAWRAVHMLITSLETGEDLSVHIIDAAKAELAADTSAAADNLAASGVCKLLVEKSRRSPGVAPWGLLVCTHEFEPTREDAELLGRLAKVCAAAGAPLIAGASARLAGCPAFGLAPDSDHWNEEMGPEAQRAWESLRELPEAEWVALAAPRVILRSPYGRGLEETERFAFEELPQVGGPPSAPAHEAYLWGSGAIACGVALGRAFGADGWDLDPELSEEVGGLAVHSWKERGEVKAKPCAEAWITDKVANAIRAAGLTPVQSIRGRDAVRVAGLQSIAGGALKGRWS